MQKETSQTKNKEINRNKKRHDKINNNINTINEKHMHIDSPIGLMTLVWTLITAVSDLVPFCMKSSTQLPTDNHT